MARPSSRFAFLISISFFHFGTKRIFQFLPVFAFLTGATSALATVALTGSQESVKRPNIVFIFADDVGREVLGCYGGRSYLTPNIDKLASNGMRFNHFYASPVCHPSRITVMTGRYPSSIGYPKWGAFPDSAESETVANVLKQQGYRTVASGKWQLTKLEDDPTHPFRLGYEEYCFFGWHEGPRYWNPRIWQNGELIDDLPEETYGPDLYLDFLIDFIERNKETPFFAYYPMTLCHAVSNDFMPRPPHGPKGRYELFDEMVYEMDLRVGRLIKAIEELGLSENTLIIFSTDNGSPRSIYSRHVGSEFDRQYIVSDVSGELVPGAKGKLTDWGIRVPGIASWPGIIKPGTTSEALIDLSDLLPTFAELSGAPMPTFNVDGVSFAGLLTGDDYTPRDWIYALEPRRKIICLRTRDWKLLSNGALFDMQNDPEEKNPIRPGTGNPESKRIRSELQAILSDLTERATQ